MSKSVAITALSEIIIKELEEYSAEVERLVKEELELVAKQAKKNIQNHPNVQSAVRTGKYKKGFKLTKAADGMGYRRYKLSNKKYQIGHLLESGHKTQNGGFTRAFPHWGDIQKEVDETQARVIERIKNAK